MGIASAVALFCMKMVSVDSPLHLRVKLCHSASDTSVGLVMS